MRNVFLSDLDTRDRGNGKRMLVSRLDYVDCDGKLIQVPVGFETDFASIPPLARMAAWVLLLSQVLALACAPGWYLLEAGAVLVVMMAEWLENESTDKIATVHDYIYRTRCRPRWKADWILYVGMEARNAPRSGTAKSALFWVNVRLFGWKPWRDDALK